MACAAKDCRRNTTKKPVTPAATETASMAQKAWTVKSYCQKSDQLIARDTPARSVRGELRGRDRGRGVGVGKLLFEPHDDPTASRRDDDFDGVAVEITEHRFGDDLIDGATAHLALGDPGDLVDNVSQRIEIVRHHNDGRSRFVADEIDEIDDLGLGGEIEGGQGFIEQQEWGAMNESLGQGDALALSSRELRQGSLGEGPGAR
jgi:hypothetical protein